MPPKKILDQVRDAIRVKHYSYHTEQAYVDWVKRYILYQKKRHPAVIGAHNPPRTIRLPSGAVVRFSTIGHPAALDACCLAA